MLCEANFLSYKKNSSANQCLCNPNIKFYERNYNKIIIKGNVAVYKVLNIEKRHNYAS